MAKTKNLTMTGHEAMGQIGRQLVQQALDDGKILSVSWEKELLVVKLRIDPNKAITFSDEEGTPR